jgi:hypothetical protein
MILFKIKRNNQIVADGCIFFSGKCVISWRGDFQSVVVWDNVEQMKAVNGTPGTEFIIG